MKFLSFYVSHLSCTNCKILRCVAYLARVSNCINDNINSIIFAHAVIVISMLSNSTSWTHSKLFNPHQILIWLPE